MTRRIELSSFPDHRQTLGDTSNSYNTIFVKSVFSVFWRQFFGTCFLFPVNSYFRLWAPFQNAPKPNFLNVHLRELEGRKQRSNRCTFCGKILSLFMLYSTFQVHTFANLSNFHMIKIIRVFLLQRCLIWRQRWPPEKNLYAAYTYT